MILYGIALELHPTDIEIIEDIKYNVAVYLIGSNTPLLISDIIKYDKSEETALQNPFFAIDCKPYIREFRENNPDKYLGQFYITKDKVESIKQRIAYLISDYNNAILLAKAEKTWVQKLCKFILTSKDGIDFYFKFLELPPPPAPNLLKLPEPEQINEYGKVA